MSKTIFQKRFIDGLYGMRDSWRGGGRIQVVSRGRHINISPAPEAQFTGQEVVITGNLFLAYLLTSSANHIILTIA